MFLEIIRPKGSGNVCLRYAADGAKPITVNLSTESAALVAKLLETAANSTSDFRFSFSIDAIAVVAETAPTLEPKAVRNKWAKPPGTRKGPRQ